MRGHLSLWLWVHGRFLVCDPSEIHGAKPLRCAILLVRLQAETAGYTPEVPFSAARLCQVVLVEIS